MTTRALVIVNYRSSALTRKAIESARRSSSTSLHVVVVDNSLDERELELLEDSGADRVVRAESNLGYAGGINLGLTHAMGDTIVISNPDVTFIDDAIDTLCDHAEMDAGIAGPRFTWDEQGRWLLPPADLVTATSKISELVSMRSETLTRRRRNLRFRRRVEFWRLERPTRVSTLSGAVLAFSRPLFDAIGPFDERFRLYFEETDYLRRVRQKGEAILYLPGARCRHAYNQSAGGHADARRWYAESEAAYFRKWYGHRFDRALRLVRPARTLRSPLPREAGEPRITFDCEPREVVIEVSPLADFDVAAGHFPQSKTVELPDDVVSDYRDADLFMRAVEKRSGDVLDALHWRKQTLL